MLKKGLLSACIATSVLLTACHDDDDQQSNESPSPTTTYSNLSGTAAVGAAIKNADVTANCKDGTGFKNEVKTNNQGEWSGQVDSAKLPCALEVKSPTQTLHGYAAKVGNINITPFTDLALALASTQTPSEWYKTYQPILETTLKTAVDNLTNQLKADGYALPNNFDLLTTKFAINDTFDKALDTFAASLVANPSTIKDYAALIEKIKTGDLAALPDAQPLTPTTPTDTNVSGPLTAASSNNTAEFLNALKKDDYYLKVESSFGGAGTEFPVGSIHKVGITKEGNVTIQGKTQAYTYSYRQHTLSDFQANALTFYNAAGTGVELYIKYDPTTGYLTVEPQGMVGGEGGVKLVSNRGTPTTPTEPTTPTTPTTGFNTAACTKPVNTTTWYQCGSAITANFISPELKVGTSTGTGTSCTITKTGDTLTFTANGMSYSAKLNGEDSDAYSTAPSGGFDQQLTAAEGFTYRIDAKWKNGVIAGASYYNQSTFTIIACI